MLYVVTHMTLNANVMFPHIDLEQHYLKALTPHYISCNVTAGLESQDWGISLHYLTVQWPPVHPSSQMRQNPAIYEWVLCETHWYSSVSAKVKKIKHYWLAHVNVQFFIVAYLLFCCFKHDCYLHALPLWTAHRSLSGDHDNNEIMPLKNTEGMYIYWTPYLMRTTELLKFLLVIKYSRILCLCLNMSVVCL